MVDHRPPSTGAVALQWSTGDLCAALRASASDQALGPVGPLDLVGQLPPVLAGLGTDSRQPGSGRLFVALAGERFDGHDFLDAAAAQGYGALLVARAALADRRLPLPALVVDDPLAALGAIAAWHRRRALRAPVVGLTGSVGKTTTKELIAAALGPGTHKTAGNLNNLVGVPLTLLAAPLGASAHVVELGTSLPGEIRRLTAIAGPDVGLVTAIRPVHLAGLGSLAGVAQEKGALYAGLGQGGVAVHGLDDELVAAQAATSPARRRVRYSLARPAEVRLLQVLATGVTGTHAAIELAGARHELRLPLPGEHNLANALAALATLLALDRVGPAAGPAATRERLAALATVDVPGGRFRQRPLAGRTVVDDTYNANPASVRAAIATVRDLAGAAPIWVCLGDMAELGPDAATLHAELGAWIAAGPALRLLTTGRLTPAVQEGAAAAGLRGGQHFADQAALAAAVATACAPGAWVLVKGSRSAAMERVIEELERVWR